jgi:hypothetical protein
MFCSLSLNATNNHNGCLSHVFSSYIHMSILLTLTMTTTALAVDYPSDRRTESIISQEEMCICVCGGISTTIFALVLPAVSTINKSTRKRERSINGLAR